MSDSTHRGFRVLVVEDSVDAAQLLKRVLEREGFDVTTAASATEALACAERGSFDVMLSDIRLPDLSGYELMSRMKERHALAGIAISGLGEDEDLEKSRLAGFSEHLVKPVSAETIAASIRRTAASSRG